MQALNLGSKLWVPGCLARADLLVPLAPQQLRGGLSNSFQEPLGPLTLRGLFYSKFHDWELCCWRPGVAPARSGMLGAIPWAWIHVGHILGLPKGRLYPLDLNSV